MATGGRRNGRIWIVIAIVLIIIAFVAAWVFKDTLFPQAVAPQLPPTSQATPLPPTDTVDVVILTQEVGLGAQITSDMVATFPYPKEKFDARIYFTDKKDVVGKTARYPLKPPLVLTAGLLSSTPIGGFASSQIPPGYVAIPIPVDSPLNAVANGLQPGDHVSVLVSLLLADLDQNFQTILPNKAGSVDVPTGKVGAEAVTIPKTIKITSGDASVGRTELDPVLSQPVYVQPGEAQRPRSVSQILISDAIVLAIGDIGEKAKESLQGAAPAATATPGTGPAPTPGPTAVPSAAKNLITLVVSPQDAVTINYVLLTKGAKLNLVLRSASENKQFKTEAVTLQFLMDQYNIPLPSKLQYGLEPATTNLNDTSTNGTTPATGK